MRFNATTALVSSKVLLVPYEPHHVKTYSAWMEDEDIREATASERLTLIEEYEMQRKWREDADKLTFIVCLPPATPGSPVDDSPARMIGDVNLFLYLEDSETEVDASGEARQVAVGEIEIMVAEKAHRGRGLGRGALLLFLAYVLVHQGEIMEQWGQPGVGVLEALRVKIGSGNERSLKLFESVGFVKKSEVESYFGEFELVLRDMGVEGMERRVGEFGMEGWREVVYGAGAV
ncbi:uncharacterized protein H6S33_005094 [Morchella sextelata]|uniref:uncharacterized protein n=1 Tax=Morchella sextelata TaxID=1174677 RepID=UPI001D053B62|nr:uncharacterized protein H6S33_005094 [Morchella sextelata]KAH0605112.1 hypothetical protein H6S33_005094 [Morchella sextelata]